MSNNLFTENLNTLQGLIAQSAGNYITYGGEKYRFTQQATVSAQEIADFEAQHRLQLPSSFKEFLLAVGACTLFEDEQGFAHQFFAPHQWEAVASEVFEGTGANLFPQILLVAYPSGGHQEGFVTSEADAFGAFYSEIPPEYWEEDTELTPFADWLREEMETYQ